MGERDGFLGKTKGFIEPKALRLNAHQYSYVTRADRRVQGWLRRNGWIGGWVGRGMGG